MTAARTATTKPRPRLGKTPRAQLLPFANTHGGRRKGAGRKPKRETPGVDHRPRPVLASRFPILVTVKLCPHLPRLRQRAEHALLRAAFTRANTKTTFRVCHYVILNDHLHFLAEAQDRMTLARGLQGLLIRVAKNLNKLWQRKGTVFADRYHGRILRSPTEVKNALRYVLANGRKHTAEGRHVTVPQAIDTYSSAPWFDGFREHFTVRGIEVLVRPIALPHTWLLRTGWRKQGLLSVHEMPKTG
jgi:REP element-mobilizing transposase RayT